MKLGRKLLALLLTLASLMVLVAGCQNSGEEKQVVNILSANYE